MLVLVLAPFLLSQTRVETKTKSWRRSYSRRWWRGRSSIEGNNSSR